MASMEISSQLSPPVLSLPVTVLSAEEKEEIAKKAIQRAEREEKLARAMGLLGPSRMIYGDREAASSLPLSSSSSSPSSTSSSSAAAATDSASTREGAIDVDIMDSNAIDSDEDEDEAILRKIDEERRASKGRLIWSHKGIIKGGGSSSSSSSSLNPPPPPPPSSSS
jgi:transposase-like protein